MEIISEDFWLKKHTDAYLELRPFKVRSDHPWAGQPFTMDLTELNYRLALGQLPSSVLLLLSSSVCSLAPGLLD